MLTSFDTAILLDTHTARASTNGYKKTGAALFQWENLNPLQDLPAHHTLAPVTHQSTVNCYTPINRQLPKRRSRAISDRPVFAGLALKQRLLTIHTGDPEEF